MTPQQERHAGLRGGWQCGETPPARSVHIFPVTKYFAYTRTRPDRAAIQDAWIVAAIERPVAEVVQGDGRIRRWVYIPEVGRFLRVILLQDAMTVHNAFFDRGFEP